MGSYGSGNQVMLPATNVAVSSAKILNADTELAGLLGPRDIVIPMASHPGGGSWVFNEDNNPPCWEETSATNKILHIGLPVHKGMEIDAIHLILGGTASGDETPDGEIVIYKAPVANGATKAVAKILDNSDPWVLGGSTAKKCEFSAIGLTIVSGYIYWLELASVGGGVGGDECYYYGGILRNAQLGA